MLPVRDYYLDMSQCLYGVCDTSARQGDAASEPVQMLAQGWQSLRAARCASYRHGQGQTKESARLTIAAAGIAREVLEDERIISLRTRAMAHFSNLAGETTRLSHRRREKALEIWQSLLALPSQKAGRGLTDASLVEAAAILLGASIDRARLPLAPSTNPALLSPSESQALADALCLWAETGADCALLPLRAYCYYSRGLCLDDAGDTHGALANFMQMETLIRDYMSDPGANPSRPQLVLLHWLLVLGDIAAGDAMFGSFDYTSCFDKYCRAVRRYRDWDLEGVFGPSPVMARAKIQKGKVFLENGHFKRGSQWLLEAMRDLAALEPAFAERETSPEPWAIALRQMESVRVYLEEEADGSRINKYELATRLRPEPEECKALHWLHATEVRYGRLWSDAANRLGFALGVIRLPNPAEGVARDWLAAAVQLDTTNPMAAYDYVLLLAKRLIENRDKHPMDSETLKTDVELLRNAYWKATDVKFIDNPERTAALWFLTRKAAALCSEDTDDSPDDSLAAEEAVFDDIFARLLTDIGHTVTRPEEIAKYLLRRGAIRGEDEDLDREGGCLNRIVCLRRWNSFTPRLPRPRAQSVKGGGYLLIWHGKGIAIDPGFDFIENLYDAGYSLEDVHAVIVTHAHIDHTDDLDALLTLIYERNDYMNRAGLDKLPQCLDVFLNQGSVERYSPWLCALAPVASLHSLPDGWTTDLRETYGFVLETPHAQHNELISQQFAIGLIFSLFDGPGDTHPSYRIGITGDTGFYDAEDRPGRRPRPAMDHAYHDCDLVFAHLGTLTLREFVGLTRFEATPKDLRLFGKKLAEQCKGLSSNVTRDAIAARLGFSSFNDPDSREALSTLLSSEDANTPYSPKNHLGLNGVRRLLRGMVDNADVFAGKERGLVLTEFPEELGSFRHVLVGLLEKSQPESLSPVRCLTGDIGLSISLPCTNGGSRSALRTPRLGIRCTECAQNPNLSMEATYAPLSSTNERCIRAEAEGMFYFCAAHDPGTTDRPYFMERATGPYFGVAHDSWHAADHCSE